MRKVLHLEIKSNGEHKYYGSLVALCLDNENIIPQAFYHTLKRIKFESPYENEVYKIRLGSLLTPADVKAGSIAYNVSGLGAVARKLFNHNTAFGHCCQTPC